MRRRIAFVLGAALLIAVSALAATGAGAGGRPFTITMTGAAERPSAGDPDGTGTASITLNQGLNQVCFHLVVSGIAPATAAHIHVAPPSDPGPIVVPLAPPTSGESNGCVDDVDPELIKAIRQDPGAYYINVHNADFPAGALRGQLSK